MVCINCTIIALMFSCSEDVSDTSSVVNTEKEETIVEEPTEEQDTSEPSPNEEIIEEEVLEEDEPLECPVYEPDPFIDHVVSYTEGEGAGFGQDNYPDIVLGPPMGAGPNAGSLDVLSLGMNGGIIVSFEDWIITDDDGVDLIVFENPFTGWVELGEVSASQDGEEWFTWSCDRETWEGCAGITPVLSHPDNCLDARDPLTAGGDTFDLTDIGLESAKYIRIQDVSGEIGGFDLDAIAIVNGMWE